MLLACARGHHARHVADLTHVFTEGFPVFTGDATTRETLFTIPSAGFYSQKWTFGEHSGTHMDAPGHFVLGGRLSPDITPQDLIVPLVVVDITTKAATNPDAGRHRGRPARVRARARSHPRRSARGDELGLA